MVPGGTPQTLTLQKFVDAVKAEVPNLIGKDKTAALQALQTAADAIGTGATVAYVTEPDTLSGEGTVKVTYNAEDSAEINVDIIA